MSNPPGEALDKLARYELALHQIADEIRQQMALEAHQRECGLSLMDIDFARADAYKKIARITMTTLGHRYG